MHNRKGKKGCYGCSSDRFNSCKDKPTYECCCSEGPCGPQGEPGCTGPQGTQGQPGPIGPTGPAGTGGSCFMIPGCDEVKCIQGSIGPTGVAGPNSSDMFCATVVPGGIYPTEYNVMFKCFFDGPPVVLASSDEPATVDDVSYRHTVLSGGPEFMNFVAIGCVCPVDAYVISRSYPNTLLKINAATGELIEKISFILMDNGSAFASFGHALAADPTTKEIYAVVSIGSHVGPPPFSSFKLIKIDVATKTAKVVYGLGDRFSSITFDSTGQLWGVVGNAAADQGSPDFGRGDLYKIDKNTGVTTKIADLSEGLGQAFHVIGFNPDDNLLYHIYGNDTVSTLESWDPANPLNLPVFIADVDDISQWSGLAYNKDGEFLANNISLGFHALSTSGVATNLGGPLASPTRGLALITH